VRQQRKNKEVTQMPGSFTSLQSSPSGPKSWTLTRLLHVLRRSEDGQAVVELAVVLPVLLILVLGIVDFGRAVNYWNNQTHLANLAARYAAVGSTGGICNGKNYSKETTFTPYILCEAGIDSKDLAEGSKNAKGEQTVTGVQGPINVCVSIQKETAGEAVVGEAVEVKVTSHYNWLPIYALAGHKFAQSELSGEATMRLEQVPPPTAYQTTKC